MAGTKLVTALSLLAGAAFAAPLTSSNSAAIFEKRSTDLCKATSECVPFTIEVSWGHVDATGAGPRGTILTNGSFPGPALRLKVGECVDFKVVNNLDVDTGVHFHGIQQTDTPWADGVPGLSQYAIKPQESYMSRWTADEAGAYFYHSHYKGQIMDGLYGAIFITPSDGEETPFAAISADDVDALTLADAKSEPIFISDWSKYTWDDFYKIEQAGNVDIACADAIVLNGMGSQYCLSRDAITSMTPPQITQKLNTSYTDKGCIPANTPQTQGNFTRNLDAIPDDVFNVCTESSSGQNYTLEVDADDKWAAITFINPSGFALLKATIDNHKMYVYDYNGRYIAPQTVDQITIANGERVSVFVKLDQAVGDYTIRVANLGLNQIVSGFGVLSYKGSDGPSATAVPLMNYGGIPPLNTTLVPFIPPMAAPLVPEEFSETADRTFKIVLQKLPAQSDAYKWSLAGNTSYDMSNDDGTPLLYKDISTVAETDIVKKTNFGEWVDIIMVTPGPLAQPHPIHKHGNKFFVIGQGLGSWNWSTVAEAYAYNASMFNFHAAPYVDGVTTMPGEGTATWTVIRYKVENPGAWFLHCHMQTHFSGGMGLALLDGVDKWPTVPKDAGEVCQGHAHSNSTWNPSCACPASCAANPGVGPDGTGNSTTGEGSPISHWSANGTWTGSGSPVSTSNDTSYSVNPETGSYSNASSSTTTSSSAAATTSTFTGAANSLQISLFTVFAVAAAFAFSL